MDVARLIRSQSRRFGLEQVDAFRGVEVVRAFAREARIAHRAQRPLEPGLMVQADSYEQRGSFEFGELAWLHFDGVRILEGWRQTFYANPFTAHHFDQGLEICRGGDD